MKLKPILRTLLILTVLITNISCDRISKNIVRHTIADYEEISVIGNYVTLTKVENTGAFLSLGHSLPKPIKMLLLTILPVIVLGLALLYLIRTRTLSNTTVVAICFVISGGMGNIYDRLMVGSVTDFLHMDFVIFQTGIFNMADVSIMVGVFIMLIETLRGRRLIVSPIDNSKDVQRE